MFVKVDNTIINVRHITYIQDESIKDHDFAKIVVHMADREILNFWDKKAIKRIYDAIYHYDHPDETMVTLQPLEIDPDVFRRPDV